ncbi:27158_t:CDS:2 [Gigaspora margarita]|uniref:27158_t:CDS:1 n=1 Tax=Gigaspora margarita TaxID=4874 RepID=A0ABM8VVU1_GIGMA|nr:27158_t:CDS:2 [Gigaspora margarita]
MLRDNASGVYLLLRQENKRIIGQEINLLCQLIVQKDEMCKELQASLIQAKSNFQKNFKDIQKSKNRNKALLQVLKSKIEDCIDNKKKIADQKVLINKLIEQLE